MTELPGLLLPYQQEAILLANANQLFVCEKSRRTGLTYAFSADAVLTAAAEGGRNCFYIAYNLEMTREFINYCGDFAKAFDRIATVPAEFLWTEDGKDEIKAFRIDFPSGHSIVALSSKPRSLRGMQGNVIIDEAAFHDDLDGLLASAQALTMWGGHITVISTHNGADNAFNVLVEEIRAGKTEGVVQRLTIDDALEQGLFKRICIRTGQAWSPEAQAAWLASLRKRYRGNDAEELDVIPSQGSGVYLARAVVAAAMGPGPVVLRLRLPPGFELRPPAVRTSYVEDWFEAEVRPALALFDTRRRSYFGGDFGRTADLTSLAFGQEDEMLTLIARLTVELRNCPYREQEWLMRAILTRLPLFSAGKGDGRNMGGPLMEALQTDFGFDRIESVMATAKTYLAGMPKLKSRIEDRRMLLPFDEEVRDDFTVLKLVRGVPMVVDRTASKADGAKGKRHGDTVIAYMNLVMAADEPAQDLDFTSTGQSRESIGGTEAGDAIGITDRGFGTVGGRIDMQGYR